MKLILLIIKYFRVKRENKKNMNKPISSIDQKEAMIENKEWLTGCLNFVYSFKKILDSQVGRKFSIE